jgi:hypothetical protein
MRLASCCQGVGTTWPGARKINLSLREPASDKQSSRIGSGLGSWRLVGVRLEVGLLSFFFSKKRKRLEGPQDLPQWHRHLARARFLWGPAAPGCRGGPSVRPILGGTPRCALLGPDPGRRGVFHISKNLRVSPDHRELSPSGGPGQDAYAFHKPCRLQYSRAVTFSAVSSKVASGASPGERNFR